MSRLHSIPWLAWMVIIPLMGATAFFFIKKGRVATAAVTVSGILISMGGLAFQVWTMGPQRHFAGGWNAPLGIALYADGLSVVMLAMTAVTGLFITIYAAGYFSGEERSRGFFWPLWMFLWAALNALFLSADIFNIYVTLELLGLAAVALVTLSGSPVALTAGMRYLFVALLGSLCYLMGVALLYAEYGVLDIGALAELIAPGPSTWAAITLMTAGLIAKTALFPLHFWLPPAHANAPAPVSAMLSGLVVKASFYLLLRLWLQVFPSALPYAAGQFLGILGASAILWGSFLAIRQTNLKMLIAYSTVAQIGYLFLLFPFASLPGTQAYKSALSGCIYHAISHACAKAAMFMAAGNIIRALGHDRLDDIGYAARHLQITFFAVGLSGISLMGLPVSGGFTAKWFFLNAALASGQWWWAVVIVCGGLMAAWYVLLILQHAFIQKEGAVTLRHVPKGMEAAALALSLLSLALGLTAEPVLRMLRIGSLF